MIVRRVFPERGDPIDTASPGARARLAELYPPTGLRVNLVMSADGAFQDAEGTSAGLTTGADRAILGAIRSVSDAVLIGAATLRAEPGLAPRSTSLVVLTRTGEFGGMAQSPLPGGLVIAGPRAAERRARETLSGPFEFVGVPDDLRATVRIVRSRYSHVVCEGGPNLVRSLLAARLVEELCLTTSPILTGGVDTPSLVDDRIGVRLSSLLVDDAGATFARWGLSATAGG